MTPGITILLLLIGWIAIALWVGKFVYRHAEKRWVQIVTVLVVLWLPLWDVIPGLYFYYKAVRQISGVHVHRQVTAQGYLDRSRTNDSFAWSLLKTLPYQYMEVEITRRFNLRQSSLADVPGYYQFSFADEGSRNCENLDGLFDASSVRNRKR